MSYVDLSVKDGEVTHSYTSDAERIKELEAEHRILKAENKVKDWRIQELEGQLGQMRESTNYVAKLEAERDTWHKMWEEQGIINDRNSKHWQSQYNDLIAERDRLREALLLISSSKRESPSYCLDPKVGLAKARGIARKALEES